MSNIKQVFGLKYFSFLANYIQGQDIKKAGQIKILSRWIGLSNIHRVVV